MLEACKVVIIPNYIYVPDSRQRSLNGAAQTSQHAALVSENNIPQAAVANPFLSPE